MSDVKTGARQEGAQEADQQLPAASEGDQLAKPGVIAVGQVIDSGLMKPSRGYLTVDELLDLYLDGRDASRLRRPARRVRPHPALDPGFSPSARSS